MGVKTFERWNVETEIGQNVMAGTRPLKVFLCHAATDKPKVETLYRRLVEAGFDPWLDVEKLLPGQE